MKIKYHRYCHYSFFTYKRFNLESLRNVVKGTQLVNGRAWAQGWVFASHSFQSRWSLSVVLSSVHLIYMLHLLPLAAVSNYCRLGGLKQQKFIVSVLKSRNVKSACRPGCVPCRVLGVFFFASSGIRWSLTSRGLWPPHLTSAFVCTWASPFCVSFPAS